MDEQVTRDILRRLDRLERGAVKLRKGVVSAVSPLSIQAGGETDNPYTDVSALGGLALNDDVVFLTAGHSLFALGASGSSVALGTHFGDRIASAPASNAAGAVNSADFTYCLIPQRTTIAGIRYRVGGTSSGNVRSGLYDAAGNLLAERTAVTAQNPANNVQDLAFDASITVNAGVYYAAILLASATGTKYVVNGLVPSRLNQAQGSFALPVAFLPPATQGGAHTLMTTF